VDAPEWPWPGIRSTFHDGVFFCESTPPGVTPICRINVEISRQNGHLEIVKEEMARRASAAGTNAIVGFRYGQRAHKWWEQMFSFKWDSESWWGEGEAVSV